jgi:hypothetical protein
MAAYDIGNKIRITGTFTNPLNGDAKVDPDTVYCSVCNPSSEKTHYEYSVDEEVIKSSTGVYYLDLPLDESGNWYVRWWGVDGLDIATVAEEVFIECTAHRAV